MNDSFFIKLGWWLFVVSACFFIWAAWRAGNWVALAGAIALVWINGLAVRFTMGAFALNVDSVAILIGCGAGLLLGVLGALPPALKALRLSVAAGLKAI